MFPKSKSWLAGGLWRPKNPHSLEHLKYLYSVLCKNQTVTEGNRGLLVETLRSISEILIWGDQNDSSVFDFFLEKNMLSFFLRYMRQKSGRFLCVQLLQTLNILFENISNETSVYYLLSNNHINSIIVHKFDFSDEEVMAYYISFLKTLSLKLNKHTIHFFYNEHTNDFALYTEAIKFFNHSESMVRIAVRTITLNTYRVEDKAMLRYIRNKTAAPYFSNLVWFIGNHILELDCCVRNDADHNSRDRLADLVAEHLDHLHYLNDILCLNIDALNEVLSEHLLNRLLIPLYVYSLKKQTRFPLNPDEKPAHVRPVVALFLLSQVFLIITHPPLVRQLADIILNGNLSICQGEQSDGNGQNGGTQVRGFIAPTEPLAQTLESTRGQPRPPLHRSGSRSTPAESPPASQQNDVSEQDIDNATEAVAMAESESHIPSTENDTVVPNQNSTDEEKLMLGEQRQADFSLQNRLYLESVFNALECVENDYEALFALCLLYALGHNAGINQELLDTVLMPTDKSETKEYYNIALVEKLIKIISLSCQNGSRVRLATLELTILLLKQLVYKNSHSFLQDRHLACLEGAREESTLLLRNFYKVWAKSEEIFLDMFEDEFREMKTRPLNVEYLTMDASILLPPLGTPLTGIEFSKRLPCGEVERARRAIRVFFLLRDLSLTLRQEEEEQLPLTKQEECVKVNDKLDLNNSDLIACTVISTRDAGSPKSSAGKRRKERRFLVIDVQQLILVEPDVKRLGWGVVKFVGFLQDVEVSGDKDDSRSLHVTIHKPATSSHARPIPLLSAKFVFDDHIRCMAAKQRLTKGRLRARQRKMQMIARLLELPNAMVDTMYQPSPAAYPLPGYRAANQSIPGRSQPIQRMGQSEELPRRPHSEVLQRSAFSSVDQPRAFTTPSPRPGGMARKVSQPVMINSRSHPGGAVPRRTQQEQLHQEESTSDVEEAQEAQSSPQAHAFQSLNPQLPQPETKGRHSRSSSNGTDFVQEIPLEDMSKKAKPVFHSASSSDLLNTRRRHLSEGAVRTRSSSYSPRRGGKSSPAGSGSSSPRRQSSGSPQPSPQSQLLAAGKPRRDRASSFPAELRSRSSSREGKPQRNSSATVQTKKGHETSFSNIPTRPRSTSSENCPKSLTPAKAPPSSLVPSGDRNDADFSNAPHLMPPAKPELLRSLSDSPKEKPATGHTDHTVKVAERKPKLKDIAAMKPQLSKSEATAVVSSSLAKVDKPAEVSCDLPTTATDQLTQLAQIVQKHYGDSVDPENMKLQPIVKGEQSDESKVTVAAENEVSRHASDDVTSAVITES